MADAGAARGPRRRSAAAVRCARRALRGSADLGGHQVRHPLQVFLDLKAHPERASEAAEASRERYLSWHPSSLT